MSNLRRFTVADRRGVARLVAGLQQRGTFVREPVQAPRRVLYDTFDWRLFDEGTALELQTDPSGTRLVWRSLETGQLLARFDRDDVPRFAWDLPPGPAAERLARVIEMRALLPLIEVYSSRTTMRLLDAEDKTVGRLVVDDSVVEGGRRLPTVIEVVPVRGYETEAQWLADLLAAQMVLTPTDDDVMVSALRANGFTPGAYSSKLRLHLDPDGTALDAWVTVLRDLLSAMLTNEAGLRDDLDSEFLHDYRVAVRRTRSILGEAHGIFPERELTMFRKEFAWLGRATGPTRDLDVFLLNVPAFEKGLPRDRRDDLKAFHSFLEDHQNEAHRALVADLDTPRYATLIDSWRRFLDDPAAPPDAIPQATSPATEIADDRIRRAHRRVIKRGRRIDDDSPAVRLHDLRKDAKRLRYLYECFGGLFPRDAVDASVKKLKGLQDVLGEFQDCQLQAGSLERFADQMLSEGAPASAIMAMGLLIKQLDTREKAARAAFHERFEGFRESTG